ncbi:MAG: hypothetical protein V2A76_10825 [Planctomycetota bacterium]
MTGFLLLCFFEWLHPALILAAVLTGGGNDDALPAWLDRVQTYCMVPMLPEGAGRLHASVNGVWGGMGGPFPILTHTDTVPAVQETFGKDGAAFAAACHAAGLFVVATVNGLEGFPPMLERWPDLAEMACRNARGEPAQTDENMLLMCTNNPDWVRWEFEFGKEGIDQGADMVLLDTPMSSALIAGFMDGGFCDFCMEGFEAHLSGAFTEKELKQRFEITNLDREELIERLTQYQFSTSPFGRAFLVASPDANLFQEYVRYQEQATFDTRKRLVDDWRRYAQQAGRRVAFATNAADLGTGNPGGHWIRGIMFADLFDLFVYEQSRLTWGMPFSGVERYPRGKWAAYHKLAYSIHHRRAPAVLHAHHMGGLLEQVIGEGASFNTWLGVQSAEAYAANGAYVQYHVEPQEVGDALLDKCWRSSAEDAAFVLSHRELYQGDLSSGSPLAILFLFNERGRMIPSVFPSYLGFAQAFTEASVPFDVLVGGDGHYVEDRLTAADLQQYDVLLVPSPVAPTENQRRLLEEFVTAGGTLVCQEPERLGFPPAADSLQDVPVVCVLGRSPFGKGEVLQLRGEVTATWTFDAGSEFFRGCNAPRRERVLELAGFLGLSSILEKKVDGLVSAFPILQPERRRLVVHLVNYDVDYEQDVIREKTATRVRLERPPFLSDPVEATLFIKGVAHPEQLDVTASETSISFEIPRLGLSASVVLE